MKKQFVFIFIMVLTFFAAETDAQDKFVLVIDAGHGGRDTGAPGLISKEKDLTLRYALAFGKAVEKYCPDVKVIYTRKTDRFLELWQRAEIANKNKADFFISVHINALDGGRTARGFQTYTLGKGRKGRGILTNLEVAKRENSVIFLEKDYKQTYQGFDPNSAESNIMFEFIQDQNMERSVEMAKMMQRNVCDATGRNDLGAHQENLAVLRLTSMPGCLVELGFISTPDEERFLNTEEAVDKFSKGMLNAFIRFKNKYYGGKTKLIAVSPDSPAVEQTPVEKPARLLQEEMSTKPVVETRTTVRAAREPMAEKPATETVGKVMPVAEKPTLMTGSGETDSHVKPDGNVRQQPKEEEQKQPENTRKEALNPDLPVFKVQIFTSRRTLRNDDARFKGIKDVEYYLEDDLVKYTIGASNDYQALNRFRQKLTDKFPEAFIVAFLNNKRIDVKEAISICQLNKHKQ